VREKKAYEKNKHKSADMHIGPAGISLMPHTSGDPQI